MGATDGEREVVEGERGDVDGIDALKGWGVQGSGSSQVHDFGVWGAQGVLGRLEDAATFAWRRQ